VRFAAIERSRSSRDAGVRKRKTGQCHTRRRLRSQVHRPPSANPPPSLKVSVYAEIMAVFDYGWSLGAFGVDLRNIGWAGAMDVWIRFWMRFGIFSEMLIVLQTLS
jgi:hypothetical protein